MKKNIFSILIIFIAFFAFFGIVQAKNCGDDSCQSYSSCESCGKDCEWKQLGKTTDEGFCDFSTYGNYSGETVNCGLNKKGDALIGSIPSSIPKIIHIVYLAMEIAIPIILVIFGMLDLFKGITQQKEEEIAKGRQIFIKRLISAALVFFVFMIVKILIDVSADSNKNRIIDCAECFIENKCD